MAARALPFVVAVVALALTGTVFWLVMAPPPDVAPESVRIALESPAAVVVPVEPAPEVPPQKVPAPGATADTPPAPPAAPPATTPEIATAAPTEPPPPPPPAEPRARTQPQAKPQPKPGPQSKPTPGATPKIKLPTAGQRLALAPVPDPALVDPTRKGPLPKIAPDGRKPWQVYARPLTGDPQRPRIAIVIVGLGLSQSATNTAIQQLPGAVTLAFDPYARSLQAWIAQARAAGHEVMLQLPMEPYDYPVNDPGPHTLLTSLDRAQNIERLEWLLGRFTGYVGVTDFRGAKFTASSDNLRPVMEVLRDRGLMFLDTRASDRSVGAQLAKDLKVPGAINNRFIDATASRAAIDARLNELEQIAKVTGTAVGVGYAYPVTIERVASWAATLTLKGIVLAPVSAVADRQEVK